MWAGDVLQTRDETMRKSLEQMKITTRMQYMNQLQVNRFLCILFLFMFKFSVANIHRWFMVPTADGGRGAIRGLKLASAFHVDS